MSHYLFIGLAVFILVWTAGSYYFIKDVETPSYTVLEKKAGYEIREYEPYLIAETEVLASDYSASLNEGFQILADYIFGNNTSTTTLAMTSPVLEEKSEPIAMTAPVLENEVGDEKRAVSFILPSEYALETIPRPNDSRVKIKEVPARKVAVLRFSWYATAGRVEAKKQKLNNLIEMDNLARVGAIQVAQYNPPLSIPFIRRNEIIIPISN